LHFIVEWECVVDCVLEAWTVCGPGLHRACTCPDRGEFTPPKTTQYTVNSTFSLNCKVQPYCNGNGKFSLKMTQQGRDMQEFVTTNISVHFGSVLYLVTCWLASLNNGHYVQTHHECTNRHTNKIKTRAKMKTQAKYITNEFHWKSN
jgi:hypothetical protein